MGSKSIIVVFFLFLVALSSCKTPTEDYTGSVISGSVNNTAIKTNLGDNIEIIEKDLLVAAVKEHNQKIMQLSGDLEKESRGKIYQNVFRKIFSRKYSKQNEIRVELVQRRQKLIGIMYKDPSMAVSLALNPSLKSTLPEELHPLIEEYGPFEGELLIYHEDNFENGTSQNKLYLVYDGELERIYIAKFPRYLKSGMRIRLEGIRIKEASFAAVDLAPVEDLTPIIQPPKGIKPKEIKIALFVYRYVDSPPTNTKILDTIFKTYCGAEDSVKHFYERVSRGQIVLSSCVIYPVTLKPQSREFTLLEFADYLVEHAVSNGIDMSDLDYIVLVGNSERCHAFNSIGGMGDFSLGIGDISLPCFQPEAIPGDLLGSNPVRVAVHELGHGFGLHHAGQVGCYDNFIPENWSSLTKLCTYREYGDIYDIMGISLEPFSVAHQEMLGWISENEIQSFSSREGGIYTIVPYYSEEGVKQLKILLKNMDFYSIQYGVPETLDELRFPDISERRQGVVLRYVPHIISEDRGSDTIWINNLVLQPGDFFQDPYRNISINIILMNDSMATVSIRNL